MNQLDGLQIVPVTGCWVCPFRQDWRELRVCLRLVVEEQPDMGRSDEEGWYPENCPLKTDGPVQIQLEIKQ